MGQALSGAERLHPLRHGRAGFLRKQLLADLAEQQEGRGATGLPGRDYADAAGSGHPRHLRKAAAPIRKHDDAEDGEHAVEGGIRQVERLTIHHARLDVGEAGGRDTRDHRGREVGRHYLRAGAGRRQRERAGPGGDIEHAAFPGEGNAGQRRLRIALRERMGGLLIVAGGRIPVRRVFETAHLTSSRII